MWKELLFTVYFFFNISKLVSSCSFDLLKKEHISNFNKILQKKEEINFETLFSPSFDVLHSGPMVYMNHTELMFQDLLVYCTKKVPENHKDFSTFVTGVKHTSWCLFRP